MVRMGKKFEFKESFNAKGAKIYNNFLKLDKAYRERYKDKSIYQIPFAELVKFTQEVLGCSYETARRYAYVLFVLKV